VKLPRFRLEPGQELIYTGETQNTGARGQKSRTFDECRVWVVGATKDGGWRVVTRSAVTIPEGTHGNPQREIVSLARCDLYPDGRIVETDAVGLPTEARLQLASLPANAAEAVNGWTATEERAGQRYRYRLIPLAAAGKCTLEAIRESALTDNHIANERIPTSRYLTVWDIAAGKVTREEKIDQRGMLPSSPRAARCTRPCPGPARARASGSSPPQPVRRSPG
jgi:hypothetical protein